MSLKHPETARLAQEAYAASGCTSYKEFLALFGPDAIGFRSFLYWLKGERPAAPLAQLVLREFIAGWRPLTSDPRRIWIRWSDDKKNIRKWSREPFAEADTSFLFSEN